MKKYHYQGEEDEGWQGPHSRKEIINFLIDAVISPDAWVFEVSENEAQTIEEHPDFKGEGIEDEDHSGLKPADDEMKFSAKADKANIKQTKQSKPKLIKEIRSNLNRLWECQLESIMTRIMDHDLDSEIESIRKNINGEYSNIENLVLDYWRKDGKILEWIDERLLADGDYTLLISGFNKDKEGRNRKMEKIRNWMSMVGFNNIGGCYCFMEGDKCLYIGQAKKLGPRVKDHGEKVFVANATTIRILIPHRGGTMSLKKRLNILERLLFLHFQPADAGMSPPKGQNNADDCLHFIMGEIKELATDAD
jgi:hypothetical protein